MGDNKNLNNIEDLFPKDEKINLKDRENNDYKNPNSFFNNNDLLEYAFNLYNQIDFSASLFYLAVYLKKEIFIDETTKEAIESKMSWISISMSGSLPKTLKEKNIICKKKDEIIFYKEHCKEYLKFQKLNEKFDLDIEFPFSLTNLYLFR